MKSTSPVRLILFLSSVCVALAVCTRAMALVPLQNATADFSQTSWNGPFYASHTIDGILGGHNGWAVALSFNPISAGLNRTAVYETVSDTGFSQGSIVKVTLLHAYSEGSQHTLGRFRISYTTDPRSTFADGLQNGGDISANWVVLSPTTASSTAGATMTKLADDSIRVSGLNPATDVYTILANTAATGITGFRLEALADPSFPYNGPGRAFNGNFVLTEFMVDVMAVPEPSSAALLICLLPALAWRRSASSLK